MGQEPDPRALFDRGAICERDASLLLDPVLAAALPLAALEQALAPQFTSTGFEISNDRQHVRLLGQDRSHHLADRELAVHVRQLGLRGVHEIGSYRAHGERMALTLEDSWSGWFIAGTLAQMAEDEPLVILHLDDHRDMMPSLLCQDARGAVLNPVTNALFDPSSKTDWVRAIESGVVNIGTWLTALVLGTTCAQPARRIHIRHLHPESGSSADCGLCDLRAVFREHRFFPGRSFGHVTFAKNGDWRDGSTFQASNDFSELMQDLPAGRVILHVDLDYFVNDFNGNACNAAPMHGGSHSSGLAGRLARLDGLIALSHGRIAETIVALSPGFCAARHWTHLIARIETAIGLPRSEPR